MLFNYIIKKLIITKNKGRILKYKKVKLINLLNNR